MQFRLFFCSRIKLCDVTGDILTSQIQFEPWRAMGNDGALADGSCQT